MSLPSEAREVIDDARAYLEVRALQAAVEVISDGSEALRGHEPALRQAIELLDACFFGLWEAGAVAEATAALEILYRFAQGRLFDSRGIDATIFTRYKRALVLTGSSPTPLDRYHRHENLIRLFSRTQNVSGEVAECGCARGLSSMELCLSIEADRPGWRGTGFHIFDSFEGLSAPQAEDRDVQGISAPEAKRILGMMRRGNLAFPLEQVRAIFSKTYPEVALHPGWIPESFTGLPEQRYRFVHVDVDLYRPTLGAFTYFYPRLEQGGMLVTDDYNWPGARKAVDEFCAANGVEAQLTNTNQAYLIRAA